MILIFGLVISLIARGVQGLRIISQLKIMNLTFSACTTATYGFWWKIRPEIETPILLTASLDDLHISKLQQPCSDSLLRLLFTSHGTYPIATDHIPNDSVNMSPALVQPFMAVIAASTIVFGSLHLLAWITHSQPFPNGGYGEPRLLLERIYRYYHSLSVAPRRSNIWNARTLVVF